MGPHAEGDVLIESGNFFDPHAGSWNHLIARDNGTDMDLANGDFHSKFFEDAQEVLGVGLVFFLGIVVVWLRRGAQKTEGRVFVVSGCLGSIGVTCLFELLGFDDVEFKLFTLAAFCRRGFGCRLFFARQANALGRFAFGFGFRFWSGSGGERFGDRGWGRRWGHRFDGWQ